MSYHDLLCRVVEALRRLDRLTEDWERVSDPMPVVQEAWNLLYDTLQDANALALYMVEVTQ